MDMPKPKWGCEITEESGERGVDRTTYDEEPAKYMANPERGFWKSIKEFFGL